MATDVAAKIIPGVQNYTKHDALFYLSFHHQNKKNAEACCKTRDWQNYEAWEGISGTDNGFKQIFELTKSD